MTRLSAIVGTRIIYATLLGLVGAGIVHIAILFLIPAVSDKDAWTRLAEAGDLYTVMPLFEEGGDRRILKSMDPMFGTAACRFDLTDGVAHIHADGHVPYWSISVYNRSGQNIYSFNDRTTTSGTLDLVVVTPVQMVEIRKDLPPELEASVFVETDIDEGIVVVRSFVPEESWKPAITAYLRDITCKAGAG